MGIRKPFKAVTSIAIGYPKGKIDGIVKRDTPEVMWKLTTFKVECNGFLRKRYQSGIYQEKAGDDPDLPILTF
ncbi:MAG: hypothetical protein R2861_15630 [Desulfobacterales bacterium]